jgi:excisionase family DNA binding protein
MEQLFQIQKKLEDLCEYVKKLEYRQENAMLNTDEACTFLGIRLSTLYKHTSAGNIAYYKPNGKLIMFNKKDLITWLEAHRIPSNSELTNL